MIKLPIKEIKEAKYIKYKFIDFIQAEFGSQITCPESQIDNFESIENAFKEGVLLGKELALELEDEEK